jgi:hypothetical protein
MRCVECGLRVADVLVYYNDDYNGGGGTSSDTNQTDSTATITPKKNNEKKRKRGMGTVGLVKCERCKCFCDVFVEYELSLLVLHLLLLSPRAWRHVLFNKPSAFVQIGVARCLLLLAGGCVAWAHTHTHTHTQSGRSTNARTLHQALFCVVFVGCMAVLWTLGVAGGRHPRAQVRKMAVQFCMYGVCLSRSFAWVKLGWQEQTGNVVLCGVVGVLSATASMYTSICILSLTHTHTHRPAYVRVLQRRVPLRLLCCGVVRLAHLSLVGQEAFLCGDCAVCVLTQPIRGCGLCPQHLRLI